MAAAVHCMGPVYVYPVLYRLHGKVGSWQKKGEEWSISDGTRWCLIEEVTSSTPKRVVWEREDNLYCIPLPPSISPGRPWLAPGNVKAQDTVEHETQPASMEAKKNPAKTRKRLRH